MQINPGINPVMIASALRKKGYVVYTQPEDYGRRLSYKVVHTETQICIIKDFEVYGKDGLRQVSSGNFLLNLKEELDEKVQWFKEQDWSSFHV